MLAEVVSAMARPKHQNGKVFYTTPKGADSKWYIRVRVEGTPPRRYLGYRTGPEKISLTEAKIVAMKVYSLINESNIVGTGNMLFSALEARWWKSKEPKLATGS